MRYWFYILTFAFIITACSDTHYMDSAMEEEYGKQEMPLPSLMLTRAPMAGEGDVLASFFSDGDQVGVTIQNDSSTLVFNQCYQYSAATNSWNAVGQIRHVFVSSSDPKDFKYMVYYPYLSNLPDSVGSNRHRLYASFASETSNQTLLSTYSKCDLLAGEIVYHDGPASTVACTLDHMFSAFELAVQESYTGGLETLLPGNREQVSLWVNGKLVQPNEIAAGHFRYILPYDEKVTVRWQYLIDSKPSYGDFGERVFDATKTNRLYRRAQTIDMRKDNLIGYFVNEAGEIGPSVSNATAVIFSNFTSATDYRAGYKRGYAMSLYDAPTGNSNPSDSRYMKCAWGSSTPRAYIDTTHVAEMYFGGAAYYGFSDDAGNIMPNWHAYNLDGRQQQSLVDDVMSTTAYQAFYYAKNCGFARPDYASTWFLPSNGQWWLLLKNLGKIDVRSSNVDFESNYGLSAPYANVMTRINSFFQDSNNGSFQEFILPLPDTNPSDVTYSNWNVANAYWCSTEMHGLRPEAPLSTSWTNAFHFVFQRDANSPYGIIRITGHRSSKAHLYRVRPVFAF